jgi:hypothetical protein
MAAAPVAFDAKTLAEAKRLKDSAADHGITMTLSTPATANTPARSVRIDPTDMPDTGKAENASPDDEMPSVPHLFPPSAMAFRNGAGEDDFFVSPELREVAEAMIDHYAEISHLDDVRIVYLWKREGGKKSGKLQLGQCKKVSGLEKFYADCDFIIWLATDHAKTLDMKPKQIEALLFHELCHATYEEDEDGEVTLKVKPHDLEMFEDEVRRYGLWTSELKSAKDLFAQATLPGLGDSIPYGSAA